MQCVLPLYDPRKGLFPRLNHDPRHTFLIKLLINHQELIKTRGTLPARLTFALAALIAFYRGERNGETYPVQDDAHWLERYQQLWSQHRDRVTGTQELVAIVLAEKDHWEQDLTQVPGLVEQVANDLDAILEKGMREAVRPLC